MVLSRRKYSDVRMDLETLLWEFRYPIKKYFPDGYQLELIKGGYALVKGSILSTAIGKAKIFGISEDLEGNALHEMGLLVTCRKPYEEGTSFIGFDPSEVRLQRAKNIGHRPVNVRYSTPAAERYNIGLAPIKIIPEGAETLYHAGSGGKKYSLFTPQERPGLILVASVVPPAKRYLQPFFNQARP